MRTLILALALAMPVSVYAVKNAVLVVSERGSDTAPGSFDRPVKTLHRALQLAKPGDRIIIVIGQGKIEFRVDPDFRLVQIGFGKVD